ncbi:MAG: hypothetical protein ACK46L_04150 [Synechococcaceae cyanobacterium]
MAPQGLGRWPSVWVGWWRSSGWAGGEGCGATGVLREPANLARQPLNASSSAKALL